MVKYLAAPEGGGADRLAQLSDLLWGVKRYLGFRQVQQQRQLQVWAPEAQSTCQHWLSGNVLVGGCRTEEVLACPGCFSLLQQTHANEWMNEWNYNFCQHVTYMTSMLLRGSRGVTAGLKCHDRSISGVNSCCPLETLHVILLLCWQSRLTVIEVTGWTYCRKAFYVLLDMTYWVRHRSVGQTRSLKWKNTNSAVKVLTQ